MKKKQGEFDVSDVELILCRKERDKGTYYKLTFQSNRILNKEELKLALKGIIKLSF